MANWPCSRSNFGTSFLRWFSHSFGMVGGGVLVDARKRIDPARGRVGRVFRPRLEADGETVGDVGFQLRRWQQCVGRALVERPVEGLLLEHPLNLDRQAADVALGDAARRDRADVALEVRGADRRLADARLVRRLRRLQRRLAREGLRVAELALVGVVGRVVPVLEVGDRVDAGCFRVGRDDDGAHVVDAARGKRAENRGVAVTRGVGAPVLVEVPQHADRLHLGERCLLELGDARRRRPRVERRDLDAQRRARVAGAALPSGSRHAPLGPVQ